MGEYLEAVDQPWSEIKEAQTIIKSLFCKIKI
jgi:hypothetical protein